MTTWTPAVIQIHRDAERTVSVRTVELSESVISRLQAFDDEIPNTEPPIWRCVKIEGIGWAIGLRHGHGAHWRVLPESTEPHPMWLWTDASWFHPRDHRLRGESPEPFPLPDLLQHCVAPDSSMSDVLAILQTALHHLRFQRPVAIVLEGQANDGTARAMALALHTLTPHFLADFNVAINQPNANPSDFPLLFTTGPAPSGYTAVTKTTAIPVDLPVKTLFTSICLQEYEHAAALLATTSPDWSKHVTSWLIHAASDQDVHVAYPALAMVAGRPGPFIRAVSEHHHSADLTLHWAFEQLPLKRQVQWAESWSGTEEEFSVIREHLNEQSRLAWEIGHANRKPDQAIEILMGDGRPDAHRVLHFAQVLGDVIWQWAALQVWNDADYEVFGGAEIAKGDEDGFGALMSARPALLLSRLKHDDKLARRLKKFWTRLEKPFEHPLSNFAVKQPLWLIEAIDEEEEVGERFSALGLSSKDERWSTIESTLASHRTVNDRFRMLTYWFPAIPVPPATAMVWLCELYQTPIIPDSQVANIAFRYARQNESDPFWGFVAVVSAPPNTWNGETLDATMVEFLSHDLSECAQDLSPILALSLGKSTQWNELELARWLVRFSLAHCKDLSFQQHLSTQLFTGIVSSSRVLEVVQPIIELPLEHPAVHLLLTVWLPTLFSQGLPPKMQQLLQRHIPKHKIPC